MLLVYVLLYVAHESRMWNESSPLLLSEALVCVRMGWNASREEGDVRKMLTEMAEVE